MAIVLALTLLLAPHTNVNASTAPEFTADDTLDAIDVASQDTGVSYARLYRIVGCETGYTFNPYAVGDHGGSYGAVQLNRYGNALPIFNSYYNALGLDPDPFNPYEAVYFLAESLAGAHPPLGAWSWSCK